MQKRYIRNFSITVFTFLILSSVNIAQEEPVKKETESVNEKGVETEVEVSKEVKEEENSVKKNKKKFMDIKIKKLIMKDGKIIKSADVDEKEGEAKEPIQEKSIMPEKNMINAEDEINETGIWNKVCPIKGGEVDPESPTVLYDGKTIGFCCPGCDEKFKKNPEKYIKNLSEDGSTFVGSK